MLIRANDITVADIHHAAKLAEAAVTLEEHKPRSFARGFTVHLTGNSRRRPGHRTAKLGERAATWDQWGVVIGYLFSRDHTMVIQSGSAAEDYHAFYERTRGRFDLEWDEPIPFPLDHEHRWAPAAARFMRCTHEGCDAEQFLH